MNHDAAYNSIQRSLGRMEGTLSAVHEEVHRLADQGKVTASRVDSLEASRDEAKGYKSAVVLIAGLIAAIVSAGWKFLFN